MQEWSWPPLWQSALAAELQSSLSLQVCCHNVHALTAASAHDKHENFPLVSCNYAHDTQRMPSYMTCALLQPMDSMASMVSVYSRM